MERAAQKCVDWLLANTSQHNSFKIFCGKGNNGGDGLAIARLLFQKNRAVEIFILEFGKKGSDDFQANLERLHELPVNIHFIQTAAHFPILTLQDVVIDALYGSGLNKPLDGLSSTLVQYLNASGNKIVSVDLPSGMFLDQSSKGNSIIKASDTLTFQAYKKAFLVAENADFTGIIHILDIGLHSGYLKEVSSSWQLVDRDTIKKKFRPPQTLCT